MFTEREQTLVTNCFEVMRDALEFNWFRDLSPEEIFNLVTIRLSLKGFPTKRVGKTWGVLVEPVNTPVLTEGAMRSNVKDIADAQTVQPSTGPGACSSSKDPVVSLLAKIYGAILEQNRLSENALMKLERISVRS